MVEARLEALVQRLEAAVSRQEALMNQGGPAPQQRAGNSSVGGCPLAKSFAAAVKGHVEAVRTKTAALGNDYVTEMTTNFVQLVIMQGQTLTTMARFQKPGDTQFLLAPLQAAFATGEKFKKDRKSPINLVCVLMDSL